MPPAVGLLPTAGRHSDSCLAQNIKTMNSKRYLGILAFLVLWLSAARAAHWECNIYDYRYDMTVYASLQLNGRNVAASDAYEVAAFCGDECRGVATVETVPGTGASYYYLRVRSNATDGETITFKCYDVATGEEIDLGETLAFASQSMTGYPSEPFVLTGTGSVMMGDVNGDGRYSAIDVTLLIGRILERESPAFIEAAADVSGDGRISAIDVTMLIGIILNQ